MMEGQSGKPLFFHALRGGVKPPVSSVKTKKNDLPDGALNTQEEKTMAFTRKFLADHGVPADQIDAIMDERQRTLNDYVAKNEVQTQIDKAVEEAKKSFAAPPVTESDEYKALQAQLDMRIALDGDDYAGVKPKFREAVYNMIDRAEGAASVAEQMNGIREKYEEYFAPVEPERKPQFGAPVEGKMPTGSKGASFEDVWNFTKR